MRVKSDDARDIDEFDARDIECSTPYNLNLSIYSKKKTYLNLLL